jgi:hypothetical protein
MSTATSKIDPTATRTSLAWLVGGIWKCSPRMTKRSIDSEWFSWMKVAVIPFSRSTDSRKISEKKPRAS